MIIAHKFQSPGSWTCGRKCPSWYKTDLLLILCIILCIVAGTVEGAHSDEQKSHRSDSHSDAGSGKGGNRRLPPLLGDFDVLRFKNRFLEVCIAMTIFFCNIQIYLHRSWKNCVCEGYANGMCILLN